MAENENVIIDETEEVKINEETDEIKELIESILSSYANIQPKRTKAKIRFYVRDLSLIDTSTAINLKYQLTEAIKYLNDAIVILTKKLPETIKTIPPLINTFVNGIKTCKGLIRKIDERRGLVFLDITTIERSIWTVIYSLKQAQSIIERSKDVKDSKMDIKELQKIFG